MPKVVAERQMKRRYQIASIRQIFPIQTSLSELGEERISNFLLWQMAYTEFYLTDVFWPSKEGNAQGNSDLQQRKRRFGERMSSPCPTCQQWPAPKLAVDAAVYHDKRVLLIERGRTLQRKISISGGLSKREKTLRKRS